MASTSNFQIEKKYFDFYEGTTDIFYAEELGIFLSLCNKNIYAFKIENGMNYLFRWDICYPTCLLESAVDMEDIKEAHQKKYINKYLISLFSNINCFASFKNDVFLGTDDYNLHRYRLIVNHWEERKEDETKMEIYENGMGNVQDILLYHEEEKDGSDAHCYNYNWAYLRKVHIWKSINSIVSCFNLSENNENNLIVGYNSGNINLYNLEKYKLRLTYRIHNNRISCLKIYRDFIISSDVSKHIFIYHWKERKTMFSLDDHVSGIKSFHFLRTGGSNRQREEKKLEEKEMKEMGEMENENEKNKKQVVTDREEMQTKQEEEDRIIGLVTVGNDKIVNIWNLEMLNAESNGDKEETLTLVNDVEDDSKCLKERDSFKQKMEWSLTENKKIDKKERKKQRRKNRYANTKMCKPIQQLLLSDDINDAMIIPAGVFKKSKFAIKEQNIKWVILVHDEKGTLYVYNPIQANILFELKGNKKKVNKCNICKFFLLRDELYLFREDCSILVYNINKWKLKSNYLTKIEGIFEMLFFESNGETETQNVTKKKGNTVRSAEQLEEEETEKKEEAEMEKETEEDTYINDSSAAILIGDNIIRIVKMKNLINQKLLLGHEDIVTSIKLCEKRKLLFSGSNDKNIFIWNLTTYECIYILKDNLFTINAIDINTKKFPNILVVSVCEENSLKMWKFSIQINMETLKKKKRKFQEYQNGVEDDEYPNKTQEDDVTLKGPKVVHSTLSIYAHNMWINSVVISPNGKVIATCSKDKSLKLYDTQHLKRLATLEGHKKPVQTVFFSSSQNTLFSSSYDCVRIWDLTTYECLKNIQSFDFNITSVLLWNDNYLINGYSNGNINMINLNTCEKMETISFHEDKIFCLKNFRNYIISASVNGEILFLKNENEGLVKENVTEHKKKVFYENYLEELLKNKKINESLLICLKTDKKFKFKTIIETYLNTYLFAILNILQDWEMEVTKETQKKRDSIKIEKDVSGNNSLTKADGEERIENGKQNDLQSDIDGVRNYLENSEQVTKYIYDELLKMEEEEEDVSVVKGNFKKKKNTDKTEKSRKTEDSKDSKEKILEQIKRELEVQHNDENFVLFLKNLKKKSEHSYYLYLNKLIEFITFFVTNHKYAYIATFLLNSLLIYIDYEDLCKINNYQHFFEIYNSYLPRHKNRYLHFLQKTKCFQLININFYKGDIEMMK